MTFLTPISRHGRVKMKETARDRVLSDDELRLIWRAALSYGRPVWLFHPIHVANPRRDAAGGHDVCTTEVAPYGDGS